MRNIKVKLKNGEERSEGIVLLKKLGFKFGEYRRGKFNLTTQTGKITAISNMEFRDEDFEGFILEDLESLKGFVESECFTLDFKIKADDIFKLSSIGQVLKHWGHEVPLNIFSDGYPIYLLASSVGGIMNLSRNDFESHTFPELSLSDLIDKSAAIKFTKKESRVEEKYLNGLEALKALSEGKSVQYYKHGVWGDVVGDNLDITDFIHNEYSFRVEPTSVKINGVVYTSKEEAYKFIEEVFA